MKTITVILGDAGDGLYVPITVFTEFEKARKFLTEAIEDGLKDGTFVVEEPDAEMVQHAINNNILKYAVTKYSEESFYDAMRKFFFTYYGGCGEITGIYLIEIEEGTHPLTHFDLD